MDATATLVGCGFFNSSLAFKRLVVKALTTILAVVAKGYGIAGALRARRTRRAFGKGKPP
jgi:hypothetical protein